MIARIRNVAGYGVVLGLYALATLPMLKAFPPVWPDEVNLYSPAVALARGQGMGTAVLAGFIPGIDHYTYWQPPGYFFFLSLVLRFVNPSHHFAAMRLFSWFLGAAILVLGGALLKRLCRNWIAAFLGLVVLGTTVGFMQAANVGRMEMLSLACTTAALSAYLGYREKGKRSFAALAGFLSGLALICHPAGIVAAIVIAVHEVAARASPSANGWRSVMVFAASAAAPFVPWLVYILRAPQFFHAQMAAQSTRKSLLLDAVWGAHGVKHWLMSPFANAACPLGAPWLGIWPFPWGNASLIPLAILCVGLAGMLALGRRRVEASLLGAWALAGYAVNLFMPEFWYTVCFLTPACLLLGWVCAESARRWLRAAALATLLVAAAWNYAEARLMWWYCQDGEQSYRFYCQTLSRIIPADSTVLLAAIPDPYFGLREQNPSYRMLEFVPLGVPVDRAAAERTLAQVDYVVASDCCRPRYLAEYLALHGKTVADLGKRDFLSPPVVLWNLPRHADLPKAPPGH